MIKFVVIAIALLFPIYTYAANYYVTPSGAGDKDGSSWANALDWSNTAGNAFVRDGVYYLSGGTYAAKVSPNQLSTAADGTKTITIKKASTTECALANAPATCMNQAIIQNATEEKGPLSISSPYWIIDGVYGSGSDYTSYGIKLTFSGCTADTTDRDPLLGVPESGIQPEVMGNISVSHVAMVGCGQIGTGTHCAPGIYANPSTYGATDLTIDNCYISGSSTSFMAYYYTNVTIQNSYFATNWSVSGEGCHGQQISGRNNSNVTVKSNTFNGYNTFFFGMHRGSPAGVWNIYNNIIIGGSGALYSNADAGEDADRYDLLAGWHIFNNTHVGCEVTSQGVAWDQITAESKKHYLYNNLFYGITGAAGAAMDDDLTIHDYNGFYNTAIEPTEAHKQTSASSPFISESDYRLNATTNATNNGCSTCGSVDLTAITTIDYAGKARSIWDIGAYEYIPGNATFGSGASMSIGSGAVMTLQ